MHMSPFGPGEVDRAQVARAENEAVVPSAVFEYAGEVALRVDRQIADSCSWTRKVECSEHSVAEYKAVVHLGGIRVRSCDLAARVDPIGPGTASPRHVDRGEDAEAEQKAMLNFTRVDVVTHDVTSRIYSIRPTLDRPVRVHNGVLALTDQEPAARLPVIVRAPDHVASGIDSPRVGHSQAGYVDIREAAVAVLETFVLRPSLGVADYSALAADADGSTPACASYIDGGPYVRTLRSLHSLRKSEWSKGQRKHQDTRRLIHVRSPVPNRRSGATGQRSRYRTRIHFAYSNLSLSAATVERRHCNRPASTGAASSQQTIRLPVLRSLEAGYGRGMATPGMRPTIPSSR